MERRFLGVEEIAQYLGVKTGTVYSWVNMKAIPYFKIGRLVKFDIVTIDGWIKERAVVVEQ